MEKEGGRKHVRRAYRCRCGCYGGEGYYGRGSYYSYYGRGGAIKEPGSDHNRGSC